MRSAGRAVETNFKRVESTRAARVLQERRLDAETKKFAAGMSTNFLVTQAQRDLALAEVAELRAIADYRKSLVNFERVQEAGVGGGGGIATSPSALGGHAPRRRRQRGALRREHERHERHHDDPQSRRHSGVRPKGAFGPPFPSVTTFDATRGQQRRPQPI